MTTSRSRTRRRSGGGDQRRRDGRPSKFDYSRVTVTFDSGGDACTGWLYRPDRPAEPPVVVMGSGLSLPRETLRPLAERFAERGYAVFCFDYRGVGDSEGTPRGLISPARATADWEEAVASVRDLDGVDTGAVVLWGHSLGAASAVSVAADDPRIRAVVAVAPVFSGSSLFRARPLPGVVKAVLAGVRDRVQSILPRVGSHTVPAVGDDDDLAIVSDTSLKGAYRRLSAIPDVPARSFLALARHSVSVDDVTAPLLLIDGGYDDIGSSGLDEDAPDTTLLRVPETHLGVLDDEATLEHTLVFLDDVLR